MISVCLATYNGGRYVGEQLRSVLMQLGPDDEVVISDDGSTDNTLAEIARLNDPRLRLLSNSGRAGVIRNFERVLLAARGETIFLCDQDDVWLPGKVNRCLAGLSESVLVVTDCAVVNSELTIMAPSFFRLRRSGPGLLRNLWKNRYLGCCMAMRRSVLGAALPFPAHIAMHDWWIGLVAERMGKVHFLDETLSLYRRHGGNASQATMHSTASLMIQVRWRLDMVLYLMTQPIRHSR